MSGVTFSADASRDPGVEESGVDESELKYHMFSLLAPIADVVNEEQKGEHYISFTSDKDR